MPRRELLTEPQRLAFTEPATDEREMVRHYTLSPEDLALVGYRIFNRAIYRDMSTWLLPTALATEKGSALAAGALRVAQIVASSALVLPYANLEDGPL